MEVCVPCSSSFLRIKNYFHEIEQLLNSANLRKNVVPQLYRNSYSQILTLKIKIFYIASNVLFIIKVNKVKHKTWPIAYR